jgi:hypothetical protein
MVAPGTGACPLGTFGTFPLVRFVPRYGWTVELWVRYIAMAAFGSQQRRGLQK